jgi:hypothetical protein
MMRWRASALAIAMFLVLLVPVAARAEVAKGDRQPETVILADPRDPYYALAEEIAGQEDLPIVHSLDEVLDREPAFLLWVVSPDRLSDQVLVSFGLAMRDRPSAISTGIISGATLEDARALVQRAAEVEGQPAYVANAANPSGHVQAAITAYHGQTAVVGPFNKATLLAGLQEAGYLTFTGHGSANYLRLDKETTLRAADLPALKPVVVATGSCNTFRPWVEDSIALAFTRQGAAAYAGFAYSPNEGYLMGEFGDLPFRYTWPGFPIGHVVQVQNRGTLQGFATIPYYFLLGDPRIAFLKEMPYHLQDDQLSVGSRILHFVDAPPGVIPVRIQDGARYPFVEVPGVGETWDGEPFYNARLQTVTIGQDRFVLFEHAGGDFSVKLRARVPWARAAGDVILDGLDGTLLFLQDNGGAAILLGAGLLAWVLVAISLRRKNANRQALVPAVLVGVGAAILHGLYAAARLDRLVITSKAVEFDFLSLAATFLLVACGAFLFLRAASWRGRIAAVGLASLGALAPAAFLLLVLGVLDNLFVGARLGADLWNCRLGLQPLLALGVQVILFGTVFSALRKVVVSLPKEAKNV